MTPPDDSHNIDLPACAYTVISFGQGDGRVVTYQGAMSVDAAAELLVKTLEDFDWPAIDPKKAGAARDAGDRDAGNRDDLARYEAMLDIVSLVAEINLYLARVLWRLHVPPAVGIPRMLVESDERTELRYLENLAAQRALSNDELAMHLLEHGEFMSGWGEARRLLVEASHIYV